VSAILDLNLLKQLVALASWFHLGAIKALHTISQWPDGVAALADVDVSKLQPEHMRYYDDSDSDLPKLLNNIARYKAGKLYDRVDL